MLKSYRRKSVFSLVECLCTVFNGYFCMPCHLRSPFTPSPSSYPPMTSFICLLAPPQLTFFDCTPLDNRPIYPSRRRLSSVFGGTFQAYTSPWFDAAGNEIHNNIIKPAFRWLLLLCIDYRVPKLWPNDWWNWSTLERQMCLLIVVVGCF